MSTTKIVFVCLITSGILLLSACQPVSLPESSATPEPAVIPPTSTSVRAVTLTAALDSIESDAGVENLSEGLPDLLINVSSDYSAICERTDKNQIWLSPSNASEEVVLLADDQIDFNFPRWMPNGEQFVYVESIPLNIYEDGTKSDTAGTDSVWIINADGSNHRRISDYLPSLNYWGVNEGFPEEDPRHTRCLRDTYIVSSPAVSPDGKYLVFPHKSRSGNNYIYTYYLVNIEMETTKVLHTQERLARPIWDQNANRVIIVDNDVSVVRLFEIVSEDEIAIQQFGFPIEVMNKGSEFQVRFAKGYDILYFPQMDGPVIVGSFDFLRRYDLHFDSLWKLDINRGEWEEVDLVAETIWGNPILGRDIHVACGMDGRIYLLRPIDWSEIGTYENEERLQKTCNLVSLHNSVDGDVVSFVSEENGTDGIWTMDYFSNPITAEPYLNIGSFAHNYGRILDYSWRP